MFCNDVPKITVIEILQPLLYKEMTFFVSLNLFQYELEQNIRLDNPEKLCQISGRTEPQKYVNPTNFICGRLKSGACNLEVSIGTVEKLWKKLQIVVVA